MLREDQVIFEILGQFAVVGNWKYNSHTMCDCNFRWYKSATSTKDRKNIINKKKIQDGLQSCRLICLCGILDFFVTWFHTAIIELETLELASPYFYSIETSLSGQFSVFNQDSVQPEAVNIDSQWLYYPAKLHWRILFFKTI